MNFWSTLRVLLLCCFVHVSLTTCQPLESISEEQLNQGLQELDQAQYNRYLLYSIPAASLGKNFFKMAQNVSEDCVRAAKVTLQALYTLHTSEMVSRMIFANVDVTVAERTGSTFRSQFDKVCRSLNKFINILPSYFNNGTELKPTAQNPSPAKNYIFDIPAGQKVTEWSRTTPIPFDEPEFLKFHIVNTMLQFRRMTSFDDNQRESIRITKAIDLTSITASGKNNEDQLDKLFLDTLNDFAKNPPIQQEGDQIKRADGSFYVTAFLKKVDQILLNNVQMKEDYTRFKG